MEYLGNCNVCEKHTIINESTTVNGTVKPRNTNTHRTTQSSTPKSKVAKCLRCGKVSRITIIGTVGIMARSTDQPTEEHDPELNSYALKVQIWKKKT